MHDTRLGWYGDLYAGHVSEGRFREKGASGGVITWLATQLLERDMVDAVVHVRSSAPAEAGVLFQYTISRSSTEISARSKSRYYPIELSHVMDIVRKKKGRYAFIGLPCFVKTVRRMAEQDLVFKERVAYTIGLVCGHLKSAPFATYLAWEKGITPGELEEIDFRIKLPNRRASDYVFAETADVAVGDAWLPEYSTDPAGSSVVLVRSKAIADIIAEARTEGKVAFDQISSDRMAQSQAGGLRDRRQGLAYRLFLREKAGIWVPRKRVEPSAALNKKRRRIYNQRLRLRELSHSAWQQAVSANSLQTFSNLMTPHVKRMRAYYRRPLLIRVISKLGRMFTRKH